MVQASSRTSLGEPLSPKRESPSLNTDTGRLSEQHELKPETRLYNSRLGFLGPLRGNGRAQVLFWYLGPLRGNGRV